MRHGLCVKVERIGYPEREALRDEALRFPPGSAGRNDRLTRLLGADVRLLRFVVQYQRRWLRRNGRRPAVDYSDALQEAATYYVRALVNHDPASSGAWPIAYARRRARWRSWVVQKARPRDAPWKNTADPAVLAAGVLDPHGPGGPCDERAAAEARDEAADQVAARWHALTPREALVVRLRFGLGGDPPQTLEEVARGLGVTKEMVRIILARALYSLKGADPSRFAPHPPTPRQESAGKCRPVMLVDGGGRIRFISKTQSRVSGGIDRWQEFLERAAGRRRRPT